MKRFNQNEISVYNCGGATEANCWLCASYTGLYNLMFEGSYSSSMYGSFRTKKNTFPYNPKNQELDTYNYAKQHNYIPHENESDPYKALTVSVLYKDLRKKAISYNYKAPFEGLTVPNTVKMINDVMKDYGCSIRAVRDTNYNAYTGTEAFKNYFRAGKVALFATDGGIYGNHFLAVSGFRHYKREKQILFWSYTEWKTFLEVGDGHTSTVRYFDITRFFNDHFTGSFVNFNL